MEQNSAANRKFTPKSFLAGILLSELTTFTRPGALKTREWKTRECKTWHQVAEVENAGVEDFRGVFRRSCPLLNAANFRPNADFTSLKYIEHIMFHAFHRTNRKFSNVVRPAR